MSSLPPPPPPPSVQQTLPNPPPVSIIPQVSYAKLSAISTLPVTQYNQDTDTIKSQSNHKSEQFHTQALKILKTTNSDAALAAIAALNQRVPKLELQVEELQKLNNKMEDEIRVNNYATSQTKQIQGKNEQLTQKVKQLQEQLNHVLQQKKAGKPNLVNEMSISALRYSSKQQAGTEGSQQKLEYEQLTKQHQQLLTKYKIQSKQSINIQQNSITLRNQLFQQTENIISYCEFLNNNLQNQIIFEPTTVLNLSKEYIATMLSSNTISQEQASQMHFKVMYQKEFAQNEHVQFELKQQSILLQEIFDIFQFQCNFDQIIPKIQEFYDESLSNQIKLKSYEQEHTYLEDINQQIYSKLDVMKQQISMLQNQNQDLISQNDDFMNQAANSNLAPQYPDLSQDLYEIQSSNTEMQHQNDQLAQNNTQLQQELAFVKNEIQSVRDKLHLYQINEFNQQQEQTEQLTIKQQFKDEKYEFIELFNQRLNQLILYQDKSLAEQLDNIFVFIQQDNEPTSNKISENLNISKLMYSNTSLDNSNIDNSHIFDLLSTVSKKEIKSVEEALNLITQQFDQNITQQNQISDMVFQMQQLTQKNEFAHNNNLKNYQRTIQNQEEEIHQLKDVINQQEQQVNSCINQISQSKITKVNTYLQDQNQENIQNITEQLQLLQKENYVFSKQIAENRAVIKLFKDEKLNFIQQINTKLSLSKVLTFADNLNIIVDELVNISSQNYENVNYEQKYNTLKYKLCDELNIPMQCTDQLLVTKIISDIEDKQLQISQYQEIVQNKKQSIDNMHQTVMQSLTATNFNMNNDVQYVIDEKNAFFSNLQTLLKSSEINSFGGVLHFIESVLASQQPRQSMGPSQNSNLQSLLQKRDTQINILSHQLEQLKSENNHLITINAQMVTQNQNSTKFIQQVNEAVIKAKQKDVFQSLIQLQQTLKKSQIQTQQIDILKRKIQFLTREKDLKMIFIEGTCDDIKLRNMRNLRVLLERKDVTADLKEKKVMEFINELRQVIVE